MVRRGERIFPQVVTAANPNLSLSPSPITISLALGFSLPKTWIEERTCIRHTSSSKSPSGWPPSWSPPSRYVSLLVILKQVDSMFLRDADFFFCLSICYRLRESLVLLALQSFFPAMAKIVGTLGPKSRSVEVISACLKAGMSGMLLVIRVFCCDILACCRWPVCCFAYFCWLVVLSWQWLASTSPGGTLIITRRHLKTWRRLSRALRSCAL